MGESDRSDPFSVTGSSIVITGGTAGIGRAAAAHLVAAGADVTITGRRSTGQEVAAEIGASFLPMDVADRASVVAGFEMIADDLERIDCLVLNAGIDNHHGEIDGLDLAVFEEVINVNTLGVARCLAAAVGLVPDGGSVVVTSSPAGSVTTPGMAAYAASKAAVDMLVRTWALELGARRIRVNALLPGIVRSEMSSESTPDEEVLVRLTANGVHRRPEELGPVFQFLASPASETLTGSLVGCHDGVPVGLSHGVLERLG